MHQPAPVASIPARERLGGRAHLGDLGHAHHRGDPGGLGGREQLNKHRRAGHRGGADPEADPEKLLALDANQE